MLVPWGTKEKGKGWVGVQVSWRRAGPAEAGACGSGTWVELWRQMNTLVSVKEQALPRLEEISGGRAQAHSPQAREDKMPETHPSWC